jgi:hypothetical protein
MLNPAQILSQSRSVLFINEMYTGWPSLNNEKMRNAEATSRETRVFTNTYKRDTLRGALKTEIPEYPNA